MSFIYVWCIDVKRTRSPMDLQILAENCKIPFQSKFKFAPVGTKGQVDSIILNHGPLSPQVRFVDVCRIVVEGFVVGNVFVQAVCCNKRKFLLSFQFNFLRIILVNNRLIDYLELHKWKRLRNKIRGRNLIFRHLPTWKT